MEPTAPTTPTSRRRFGIRHLVSLLLLVVVIVCIFVLVQRSSSDTVNLDGGNIERLIPTPGSKILQQDGIGIDLSPGHEALLTLDGVVIPNDQMVIVPALNQYTFKPGPGKVFEALPTGENCLVATYWLTRTGPEVSTTRSWCFTVL